MLKDIEDFQLTRFFLLIKFQISVHAKNNMKWCRNWLTCTI